MPDGKAVAVSGERMIPAWELQGECADYVLGLAVLSPQLGVDGYQVYREHLGKCPNILKAQKKLLEKELATGESQAAKLQALQGELNAIWSECHAKLKEIFLTSEENLLPEFD